MDKKTQMATGSQCTLFLSSLMDTHVYGDLPKAALCILSHEVYNFGKVNIWGALVFESAKLGGFTSPKLRTNCFFRDK